MTGTYGGGPPRRPHHYGAIATVGVVLGALAGGTAWISGSLTPLGVAILAGIVAVASWLVGLMIEGTTRSRAILAVVVVVLLAVAAADVVTLRRGAPRGVAELIGGCAPYRVFAQNRWEPFGAALRAQPMIEANQLGGYSPNQSIPVDGWVRTRAAYPSNPAPWNSDVWFHLADDSGWVSYAGVRADPSRPTGSDDGRPAPTPPECSGAIR